MAEGNASKSHFKPWFYRTAQVALFIVYKICFRFRSTGAGNIPSDVSRGIILAPNHESYLDPPLLGIALKKPITFLAKDYLFKPFIFGTFVRWLGVMPIKSEKEDFRSMRQLFRLLKEGKMIVIFPEGTRTRTGDFQGVEPGLGFMALKSGAVVWPVYIEGTFEAFPKGVKWFRCRPVSVHFGKPFVPSEDRALVSSPDPYQAVGLRVMEEIKKIKEEAHRA